MKQMLAIALATVVFGTGFSSDDAAYKAKILEWRKAQEADLKKNDGWLSVAGLFWLSEGENTIGHGDGARVKLPAVVGPDQAGSFELAADHVTLVASANAIFESNGAPVSTREMKPDSDRVTIGTVSLMVIRRGARVGVRMFDPLSEAHKQFKGMKWMPVNPKYCIQAKFVPYDQPVTLQITNVLGDTAPVPSPGYVTFTLEGQQCRLEAQAQGSGLFFDFSDATSGKTTYPAGRFLDAPGPVNGTVTLDFNQATNPPCAWTAYATCPLAPAANRLTVAIKAGELVHHPRE